MVESYCCAIDLGTSSAKLAVVDVGGRMVDSQTVVYPLESPHPGWAETPPEAWLTAVERGLVELLSRHPGRVSAVGLDGQMHGLVVGAGTAALRPAMLWPDSRALVELAAWRELPGELLAPLANPLAPGMFAPMLAWLAHHEPDVISRAEFACSPKDWLRHRLATGGPVSDPSDASATLGWDVPRQRWHAELLEATDVPVRLLPRVVSSGDAVRTSGGGGLPAGMPMSVGSADTAATLLATQLRVGEVLVNLGTGIQVCMDGATPRPVADPKCHTFATADGGWYSMVAPLNGGLVLEKVRSLLGADWAELYDSLDAPADPGVRFVPWLAPDRLPRLRAGDAAGWEGIGLATTRSDLLRAAVEAIAFQVDQAVSALPGRPTRIRFAGGGTRDERMRQLICDATGMPGRRSTITDATALGAALLGFRAAGADPVWPVPCEKQELYPRPDPGLMERRERFRQLDARISPG